MSGASSFAEIQEIWYTEQNFLTTVNLYRAFSRIQDTSILKTDEKQQLIKILAYLFGLGHADMIKGRKGNPVHHNTQVLDTMLQITLGKNPDYEFIGEYGFIKNATALALLHDIGYAKATAEKKTLDQIKKALEESKSVEEKESTIREAVWAREEHMIKGAGMIESMLRKANSLFREPPFSVKDIHSIGEAVEIHDKPSCAQYKKELKEESSLTPQDLSALQLELKLTPQDLLPLDNWLAMVLREADRLWMISPQGLRKSLISEGITPASLEQRLRKNSNRFKQEKELYDDVYKEKAGQFQFKHGTLLRTDAGYEIYRILSEQRVQVKKEMQFCLAVDVIAGSVAWA